MAKCKILIELDEKVKARLEKRADENKRAMMREAEIIIEEAVK